MNETAAWFARAAVELSQTSARQVEWARGVAADPDLVSLVDRLPREHRQPSLIFAVARYCGAPDAVYPEWREWVAENWPRVEDTARGRRTQTNEPLRCAPLMVALARIPGPIALLELGAAAGLCLIPDRYSYRYDDAAVLGSGEPLLDCTTDGPIGLPDRMPEIVWRRGVDLNPLDPADPDDRRWLNALVPPDRPDRLARLDAACRALGDEPNLVVEEGDALESLPALAASAPEGATLVVTSLGTAVYFPPADRNGLLDAVAAVGGRAVTLEAIGAIPGIRVDLTSPPTRFVLALNAAPIAFATPHGDRLFAV